MQDFRTLLFVLFATAMSAYAGDVPARDIQEQRGTGDLGLVIERATGSVLIVDTTQRRTISRLEGFGDLSHASAVFSPDQRFGYVFGRDGGLTKIDLLTASITRRIIQAGNSIGGAISDDGRLIAVSNYEPGGVRVFDSRTLDAGCQHSRHYGRRPVEECRPRRRSGAALCLFALGCGRNLDHRLFKFRRTLDHQIHGHRQPAL